ncbi:unnamed protein product [Protopolystoma xenopodis]|uniref:Uncharacterized protein n=1 Tax=Protopolystoma xenopodis TaxID=117903 RepID=A0A448XJ30_9PLAT|nr:unnamed protein product [Protopolystoma xenopodis]
MLTTRDNLVPIEHVQLIGHEALSELMQAQRLAGVLRAYEPQLRIIEGLVRSTGPICMPIRALVLAHGLSEYRRIVKALILQWLRLFSQMCNKRFIRA